MKGDATMEREASSGRRQLSSLMWFMHRQSLTRHTLAWSVILMALLSAFPLGAECRHKIRRGPMVSALQAPRQPPSPSLSIAVHPMQPRQPLSLGIQDVRTPLASGSRPFYVVFNGEKDSLDPRAVLSLEDEMHASADDATERVRVFSFWQRPWLQRPPASGAPTGANAQSPESLKPVVLHFPPVAGGWAEQGDGDAAERAATAGAAATCGDLLLFSLPLEALNAPATLLPLHQPVPLLMAALQLQLQLRSLKQQNESDVGSLAASIAAAANRSKPLVVLLRDPASSRLPKSQTLGQEGSELVKAEDDLRASAAHTALRVLEGYWKDLASELCVTPRGGRQTPQSQVQQTELQAVRQPQQLQSGPLVPPLRALFSVHVVFVRGVPEAPPGIPKAAAHLHPLEGCTGVLQRVLKSLLREHRELEVQATSGPPSKEHEHQQQQRQQELMRGTQSFPGGSLWLFDSAATACRAFLAAPGSALQPQLRAHDAGKRLADKNELDAEGAAAFDAEIYRRRALTRFRTRLLEAAGPEEGYAVLQEVLEELKSLGEGSKSSISKKKPTGAAAFAAEARQAVEDEAFQALRALHRLQLDALRAVTIRRFELFLQQLFSGQADDQPPEEASQRDNIYVLANRISEVIRQTANNFQGIVQDYHRSMDPKALQGLLLVSDGRYQQTLASSTSAKDLAAAAGAAAADERQRLLKTLRELAASILQEHQLVLVQQQIHRGFGPLQRLRQNVQHRLLATRFGGAAVRGWHRLGSSTSLAKGYLGRLPVVRELLQSPLAALWSNRKPIDVSLHYLSPTAFGMANIKNTATLAQPWKGQLHVQHLTSDANESQQSDEAMLQSTSAKELQKLKDSLTMTPR